MVSQVRIDGEPSQGEASSGGDGPIALRGAQRLKTGQGLRPDMLTSLKGFGCAQKGRA